MSIFPTMYNHAVASGSELDKAVAYDVAKANPLMGLMPMLGVDGVLLQTSVLESIPTLNPVSNLNEGYLATKGKEVPKDFKLATWRDKSLVDVAYDSLSRGHSLEDEIVKQRRLKNIALSYAYSDTLFNGDLDVDKKAFNGLKKETDKLSDIVISAGGTGSSLTSIYFIKFGDDGLQGLYNSQNGVVPRMIDMGIQNATDPNTSRTFPARQTDHIMINGAYINKAGIGRIANIDTGSKVTLSRINEIDSKMKFGYDVIVCSRQGYAWMNDLSGNNLTPMPDSTELKLPVLTYNGTPIIKTDFITQTETEVQA